MPTRTHLVAVARRLKKELNGKAFLTIQRTQITQYLREESGEPSTRIKSNLARELTDALSAQAVHVYPALADTTTGDTVRLYHAGSVLGQLVDIVVFPDPGTDAELGDVLRKVKGKWNWAPIEGPSTTAPGEESAA